jgi:hypothetical protein
VETFPHCVGCCHDHHHQGSITSSRLELVAPRLLDNPEELKLMARTADGSVTQMTR